MMLLVFQLGIWVFSFAAFGWKVGILSMLWTLYVEGLILQHLKDVGAGLAALLHELRK